MKVSAILNRMRNGVMLVLSPGERAGVRASVKPSFKDQTTFEIL